MTAQGQSLPKSPRPLRSTLLPIADTIARPLRDAECQEPASCFLFDDIIRKRERHRRNIQAEGFGSLQIDYKLEPGRLFYRQIGGFSALKYSVDVSSGT